MMDDIRYRIELLINDQQFATLLNGAFIRKEVSLSFEGNIKQIDLLLEYPDRCVVVDYKSSLKQQEKHIDQVKEYCTAIEKILCKPTAGEIIYLLKDKIEALSLK